MSASASGRVLMTKSRALSANADADAVAVADAVADVVADAVADVDAVVSSVSVLVIILAYRNPHASVSHKCRREWITRN